MGNAVPPRACRDEAGTSGGRRRRRPNPKDVATGTEAAAPYYDAAPRRTAVTSRKQRDEAEQEYEQPARAGRRRAGAVSWAGGGAAGKAPGATVATVKIVLRRKDAEALVARLNAQGARERKARMAELKGELRAVDCGGGGGGASPASCRDAWRPRLAPIKEN
ncbi:hypothetical protein GQ55_5G204100 [Panicum hallii var. hallii]|uniref:Uncharacterized protein n=1 Tax=Panicum hallii var. hallii TaxID=1504633 RepID=A0A2T7DIC6_9POAL|nr:hypothetical protein GQ55_5G204100 [Panicum hallii var. hallii]